MNCVGFFLMFVEVLFFRVFLMMEVGIVDIMFGFNWSLVWELYMVFLLILIDEEFKIFVVFDFVNII